MAISVRERRKKEICDSFDYLKHMALDALENHPTKSMAFRLVFKVDECPELSHDITEYFVPHEEEPLS